jgi:DNA-binding LacI/PurR family transcriptional regulator
MSHDSPDVSPDVVRPKKVTQQDIADVVGVRRMVVSNALNGTRSVAPATREKILRLAKEMNYVPNFAARSLRTGRTGIIAILSGALSEPYYAVMVDLLRQHLHSDGFQLMLMHAADEVQELVHATGKIAVDGVIAIDMLGLVNEFASESSIPCVSIGTVGVSFVDNVIVDLTEGVDEAMRLMIASGRQRIAYLVTAENLALESETRTKAYLTAIQRTSQAPEVINVSTDQADAVERKLKVYFLERGCPDALLCQNDETAMCAFRVLKDLGFSVPADVLLVGCDGQRHMRYFEPPLSTIVQPMEKMCAKAWKFLQQRMTQPTLEHQSATFIGQLTVRESLAATPYSVKKD